MDSPSVVEAMVEQAENLFVCRKSKILGIAMEEEKEQRRLELESEQQVLNLCNEENIDFAFNDFQEVEFENNPVEKMDFPQSSVRKSLKKSKGKLAERRKSNKGKNKRVFFEEYDHSHNKEITSNDHINTNSDENVNDSSGSIAKDKSNINYVQRQNDQVNIEIDEERWTTPTICTEGKLSEAQIKSWQEQGYTVVQNLLPMKLLQGVLKDASCTFPGITSMFSSLLYDVFRLFDVQILYH